MTAVNAVAKGHVKNACMFLEDALVCICLHLY